MLVAELRDLARGLDARETGTADDDLRPVVAGSVLCGVLDGLVNFECVVEALERVGVLLESGDAVVGGLAAQRDDGVVVVDRRLAVVDLDDAFVGVESGDLAPHELGAGVCDLADGNLDLLRDARIPNHAVGLVQNEMVVDVRDPRNIGLVAQLGFQAVDGSCTRVPGAEDDDLRCHTRRSGSARYKGVGMAPAVG